MYRRLKLPFRDLLTFTSIGGIEYAAYSVHVQMYTVKFEVDVQNLLFGSSVVGVGVKRSNKRTKKLQVLIYKNEEGK